MSEISSINFKKSKPNNLAHNERITPPSYLIGSETLQNEVNRTMSEALALKQSMINKAIETYNKNKKPKAPPFKATSYEWSAVVNLKPSSTMDDLEKLATHLQEKYGFQCYQIAIHRDEGHFENGEKIFNHHAHLEFITLDKDTGRNKFNRRDIKFQTLRDIQTETAEILQMQRGVDKRLSGAKRIEPRAWAKMKESEKTQIRALTQKIVKERLEQERKAWIKEQGHSKEDYARLSDFRKGVLKRVKQGENLTDEQFFKMLDDFIAKITPKIAIVNKQEERIKELETKLKELEKENADLKAKEASKTAENQKNDENLYSTQEVKEIIAYKDELDTMRNKLNDDIEFKRYENSLEKQKKGNEMAQTATKIKQMLEINPQLESLFSFEKYKKVYEKFTKWLKDKGFTLERTNQRSMER